MKPTFFLSLICVLVSLNSYTQSMQYGNSNQSNTRSALTKSRNEYLTLAIKEYKKNKCATAKAYFRLYTKVPQNQEEKALKNNIEICLREAGETQDATYSFDPAKQYLSYLRTDETQKPVNNYLVKAGNEAFRAGDFISAIQNYLQYMEDNDALFEKTSNQTLLQNFFDKVEYCSNNI